MEDTPAAGVGETGPVACLFWIAFLLYAFLAAYVATALSTAGDEHLYLLSTQSLYADRDLEVRNNIEHRDYERFYWGRASPETWRRSFIGFPTFLLPGYALGSVLLPGPPGGRLGATLTISLCAALLGVQLYRLCRDLGDLAGRRLLGVGRRRAHAAGPGQLRPRVPGDPGGPRRRRRCPRRCCACRARAGRRWRS